MTGFVRAGLVAMLVTGAGCGRLGFGSADARVVSEPDGSIDSCGTHDEDQDGIPDLCDVCPATPDSGQADGDGDGVGDACDPAPNTPGDRIAMFEAFAGSGIPAGWVASGAAPWAASGDDMVVGFGDVNASVLFIPRAVAPPLTFMVAYRVLGLDPAGTGFSVSVIDAFDPAIDASQKCGEAGVKNHVIGRETGGTTDLKVEVAYPDALIPGADYETTWSHDATQLRCDTVSIGGTPITISGAPYLTAGFAGLRTRAVAVAYHYLLILDRAP